MKMEDFKWRFGKSHNTPSRFRYVAVVTNECNLHCSYCFQEYERDTGCMSDDVLFTFIDNCFKDAYTRPERSINIQLIGGEVMLYPPKIKTALDYIKQKRLEHDKLDKEVVINITTNGTIVTDELIAILKEHKDVLSVNVSIDGKREVQNMGRGMFDAVVSNIHKLKSNGIYVGVQMTVSPDTVQYLHEGFVFMLDEFNVSQVFVSITINDDRWMNDSYIEKLYEQMCKIVDVVIEREVWCSLFDFYLFNPTTDKQCVCTTLDRNLNCMPNGDLYPCYVCKNAETSCKIGDYKNWIDTSFKLPRLHEMEGMDDCKNCQIGYGCKHCFGYFVTNYNDMRTGDTKECKIQHAKYFAFIRLYNKRKEIADETEKMLVLTREKQQANCRCCR